MLIGSALQTGYSLVNAFWVGNYLGTNALAAVTVSFPATFVLIAVASGLTLASNILVAQYMGARHLENVKNVVQTSTALIGLLSVLFLALGLGYAGDLLRLMNTPPDVFPVALNYVRVYFWTLPFGFSIFLLAALLRGIGDSKTPLYFQAASILLNLILDPLLIFGLAGFPKLGLNGTAVASVAAQAAAVVGLVFYIPRYRPIVSADWRRLRIDPRTGWLLMRIGFPSMIQQSVVSVSLLFVISFVSAFGATADAAFGAALRIDQVAFLPALTIGLAVSTLSGQNIGALEYKRVAEVFRWGLFISGGISLGISLLTMSYPRPLLKIFLNEPEVIEIGASYLRIVGITYTLYAVMFVSNGVINGSGHTVATTLITLVNLWGVRVPLAALLPQYTHNIEGIWIAMTVSVGGGMTVSLLYYFSGRWKKPVIKPIRDLGKIDRLTVNK